MGLPMVQVFMIMARQLSKPMADRVMSYGKSHPGFRNRVLIPIGQKLSHMATRLRMRDIGLGAPQNYQPISEAAALEQASEFVQQVVIFGYSVGVFAAYYYYQKANEKEAVSFDHLGQIKDDIDAKFFELNRRLDIMEKQLKYTLESKSFLSMLKLTRSSSADDGVATTNNSADESPKIISSIPFDEAVAKLTGVNRSSL